LPSREINAAPPPLLRPDSTPSSAKRLEGAATATGAAGPAGTAPSRRASAVPSGAAWGAGATGAAMPEGREDKRSPQ